MSASWQQLLAATKAFAGTKLHSDGPTDSQIARASGRAFDADLLNRQKVREHTHNTCKSNSSGAGFE